MSVSPSTSDAILACARSLLAQGGYNGFSYADIAAVVGIRKASIHHHFPAKADLVRTLVARYRQEAANGLNMLSDNIPDPAEQLRAYLGYWEGCITDASAPFCVCAMLAAEMPVLPSPVALEVRAHFTSLSAWLTAVFERGAAIGTWRLGEPAKTTAEGFMASVHGAMLSARAYGDPAMFGKVTHPLFDRISTRA